MLVKCRCCGKRNAIDDPPAKVDEGRAALVAQVEAADTVIEAILSGTKKDAQEVAEAYLKQFYPPEDVAAKVPPVVGLDDDVEGGE